MILSQDYMTLWKGCLISFSPILYVHLYPYFTNILNSCTVKNITTMLGNEKSQIYVIQMKDGYRNGDIENKVSFTDFSGVEHDPSSRI